MSFKDPGFQERTALAAKAKQKALDLLRAKPPIDEAAAAERRAAREAKEAAEAEKRRAKRQAEDEAKAAKRAAAQEAIEREKAKAQKAVLTEEEKKAIRDAKYAARKNRKK